MRYLSEIIKKDLNRKIVLVTGPRQVGKTWMSRHLFPDRNTVYLNFDSAADRKLIQDEAWDRNAELVVFDELHKMRNWKRFIKGIFDTQGVMPRLLVTGSARFDVWRRSGRESLAGRHHMFRLHPFTVPELVSHLAQKPEQCLELLLQRGGFPEPVFAESNEEANRWRMSHIDRILREDLLDLTMISDLRSLSYLVDRLAASVGSPISYASLSEDISVSAPTIKRWVALLEAMYVIFIVHPWTAKVRRAIQKQPKIYFYDTGRIPEKMLSARFENTVACALLKHVHWHQDAKGERLDLFYLRDKEKREVDFLTASPDGPKLAVECKLSPTTDHHLKHFAGALPAKARVLLSRAATRTQIHAEYELRSAAEFLATLT